MNDKFYLLSKTVIVNVVILLFGIFGFWMSDEIRIVLVSIGGTNLGLRTVTRQPLRYTRK